MANIKMLGMFFLGWRSHNLDMAHLPFAGTGVRVGTFNPVFM
jgi:hypothetical protein